MNATQIIAVLKQAGWPNDRDLLITMTAIALAESSGNPQAHNPRPPDDSYGLWQINMIGSLGPYRRQKYHLSSNTDLYEPVINAQIAYDIYRSEGLKAWGVYTHPIGNPAYKKHLAKAEAAYNGFDNLTASDIGNVNNNNQGNGDTENDTVIYSGVGILAMILLVGGIIFRR